MAKKTKIDLMIAEVATASTGMRDLVQETGLAVLKHTVKCGDYRKANDLVAALGKGVNGALLVDWFVKYGGLIKAAPIPGKPSLGFIDWSGKEHVESHFQEAVANKWYAKDKAEPFEKYDADKAAMAFINGYNKRARKVARGNVNGEIDMTISNATIQMLAKLINFETIEPTKEEPAAQAANTETVTSSIQTA